MPELMLTWGCAQKTLGLVMIVKDEVATINITLGSMRDHIDDWTIVDTGSTDGTQARRCALNPALLHQWDLQSYCKAAWLCLPSAA